ncbi:related to SKT5 - protoplast regeneration and killer toxin resistance protein [Melanopsichium pennsylvanicum]|uniref:Related to SKT5 - protoplast regeneration and killer toxin resistance protein n=2 Tax=Melanopsichium pennsylvanicum TaxID=63383 RepID=A0AAJ4XNK3_9BASI|nr:related to SKT5-protoplast regeneration and killer toxin resistance protein [Melanopsichium pennsylvanicum 4]SNX85092.1 related to SKT5 - protoplast regeneration and killer toxin resistance protein [Melanopsichium pennsylvanicum]
MSGTPPHLPTLPSGFGTDSSYPPMPGSTRITASQPKPSVISAWAASPNTYRPLGPPLPPLPRGALEKEQQRLRHQSAPCATESSSIFRPGQLVHAPTPPPPRHPSSSNQFVGGFATPNQHQQTTTYAAASQPPPSVSATAYGTTPSYAPNSSMNQSQSLSNNMQNLSIQNHAQAHASSLRTTSVNDAYMSSSALQPPASSSSGLPSLSAPLPDMASLGSQRDRARDDHQRVSWAKQMLKYVERTFSDGSKISEPNLVKWTDEAISIIIRNASSQRPEPEALYLRGDLQASGAFPTYLTKNLKDAFNDFELSARMGWAPSWFRIGRDYEVLGDLTRAREAYDRGVHAGDVGCIYRMGMANLLGQLELPVHHARAVALLRDAADKADLDTPQPAYIYGMLLAGEFSHVAIPAHLLKPTQSSGSTEDEARRRIQRAAYLSFAPAQYKCGWLYEYAQLGCAFDPLLSVQYYSLASQGGEIEADMALSKWFLCGAESYFEKNETLAFTFADKAARKGLASAEFALGYYHEVGVGTERNVDIARKWYRKAAAKDNADAKERLQALQEPQALGLSRQQHEAVMDDKLVRKRTLAKMLSDREGRNPILEHQEYLGPDATAAAGGGLSGASTSNAKHGRLAHTGGNQLELSRKKTMKMVEETAAGRRRPNYGYEGRPGGRDTINAAASSMTNVASHPIVQPQPRPVAAPSASDQQNGGHVASGTHPSTSTTLGRHTAASNMYNARPPQAPTSSIPTSSSTSSNATWSHATAHSAAYSVNAASSNTSAATSLESTGPEDKKPYNTFAEMGFAPQKPKKEECVIC